MLDALHSLPSVRTHGVNVESVVTLTVTILSGVAIIAGVLSRTLKKVLGEMIDERAAILLAPIAKSFQTTTDKLSDTLTSLTKMTNDNARDLAEVRGRQEGSR